MVQNQFCFILFYLSFKPFGIVRIRMFDADPGGFLSLDPSDSVTKHCLEQGGVAVGQVPLTQLHISEVIVQLQAQLVSYTHSQEHNKW